MTIHEKIDAVKASVMSTSTCTTATVVAVKELLSVASLVRSNTKAKPPALKTLPVRPKSSAASSRNPIPKNAAGHEDDSIQRAKSALATHIINATLKVLAEASKPSNHEQSPTGAAREGGSRRRSNSVPLSPVKARALNRVAVAPAADRKTAKSTTASHGAEYIALVECARAALAYLWDAKGPLRKDQTDIQVELGASSIIGKMLALGMSNEALKDLKTLKSRLDGKPRADDASSPAGIVHLMAYTETSPILLPIITTCQLQVLRVIAVSKRPAYIEAILPVLKESHPSSPIALTAKLAGSSKGKELDRIARQMASLSQVILSLAPNVATKDDANAMEVRLSPSPVAALELQGLALQAQLRWWALANHEGKANEELFSPLARCMRAFVRRTQAQGEESYDILAGTFANIMRLAHKDSHNPSRSLDSPLASIYQLLGKTAQVCKRYGEAEEWFRKLRDMTQPSKDSSVRISTITAGLLAVSMKRLVSREGVLDLLQEATESLGGSLSGTASELNELLEGLASARRSVVGWISKNEDEQDGSSTDKELSARCYQFVLQLPRFLRRWLGSKPSKEATAKATLQFDQRRQILLQMIGPSLDGVLLIIKNALQSANIDWKQMDGVLQDCLGLLSTLTDASLPVSKVDLFETYHLKISILYFGKFTVVRKDAGRSKESTQQALQSMNRSINAVKDCSPAVKEKARLVAKLEVFADLCRTAGRTEEAIKTLRSICTTMTEEGVLAELTASVANESPQVAWSLNDKASILSRTLRSIARLDKSWNEWTCFLPEAERAIVLEHLMHMMVPEKSTPHAPLRSGEPDVAALLRLYAIDKHPIRRCRVLLRLFYQNISNKEEIYTINTLLEPTIVLLREEKYADDKGLSRYSRHLQTYNQFVNALAIIKEGSAAEMREAALAWSNMILSCQNKTEILNIIDNPEQLLDVLQSTSEYASLRGESQLQLALLELSEAIAKRTGLIETVVLSSSRAASLHVKMGSFKKALQTIERAQQLVDERAAQHEPLPAKVLAEFYVCKTEYYSGIGAVVDATDSLSHLHDICDKPYNTWASSKLQATTVTAVASLLLSSLHLQNGQVHDAVSAIKTSVRSLSHEWAKLEAALCSDSPSEKADDTSTDTLSKTSGLGITKHDATGPAFWRLAAPLLSSLLQVSVIYAHVGMFQETIYYADNAWKVAVSTQSSLYKAQVAGWIGSVYSKAGQIEQALSSFRDAEQWMPMESCSFKVQLSRQLADFYLARGETKKAFDLLHMAEETTRLLRGEGQSSSESAASPLPEENTPAVPSRTGPGARSVRTTRARAAATAARAPKKVAAKSKGTTAINSPVPAPEATPAPTELPDDVHQASLMVATALSRAMGFVQQKNWSSALSSLENVKSLPKLFKTLSEEQLITATSLIGHSMDQMLKDPIFSVLQDSTISFPAVSQRDEGEDQGKQAGPPARSRNNGHTTQKDRLLPAFGEALEQAQELLLEAHASSYSRSDSGRVHRVAALLQSTVIMLSAIRCTKPLTTSYSTFAMVASDLARNITWKREQKTSEGTPAHAESVEALSSKQGMMTSKKARRSSVHVVSDLSRFQLDYIEKIPESWNVISMSLSENQHELCLTKYQAGHGPFILRLPLERAQSRDADTDTINFEKGRKELLEVIRLANETSHSGRDFTAKSERNAWWAEREALDVRLGELLQSIENTWLGGFKGIFSQHEQRPDLLARFQKNFQTMLDGCLPSRNGVGRRAQKTSKAARVTLDPRILELFIGLGDPTDPDLDMDEALNDLLYFVVDILQFHGERNAYDEIDFDAMVVETYDALRAYHDAAQTSRREDSHTVLVLDKALHAFPWESLPCMQNSAVSRVPSLACLRQMLGDAARDDDGKDNNNDSGGKKSKSKARPGHHVSAKKGTYILNPSSDLKNTQAFFQPAFSTLDSSWTGIVRKEPTESAFEAALSDSDILLYFGHGSGAQYVRSRTIKKLDKCRPATFLMGCSSAALSTAGEFECYGPVWNYLMAGCPAVVGALWDVTDRDIDRFAGRAFEEWGLFPRKTFDEEKKKKGKGRGEDRKEEDGGGEESEEEGSKGEQGRRVTRSLVEAVAIARGTCRFRYLNAAAVVVYGIPTYLKEGGH